MPNQSHPPTSLWYLRANGPRKAGPGSRSRPRVEALRRGSPRRGAVDARQRSGLQEGKRRRPKIRNRRFYIVISISRCLHGVTKGVLKKYIVPTHLLIAVMSGASWFVSFACCCIESTSCVESMNMLRFPIIGFLSLYHRSKLEFSAFLSSFSFIYLLFVKYFRCFTVKCKRQGKGDMGANLSIGLGFIKNTRNLRR